MGRGTIWEGGRFAAAAAVGALAAGAGVITASATAFNFIEPGSMPAGDVQAVVGDVINIIVPPAPPPPPGETVNGSLSAPLPASSNSTVLPRTAAWYDSVGAAHATFQAAHTGTAIISVVTPSPDYCFGLSTTSTSTTSTSRTPAVTTTATATGVTSATTGTSTTSAATSPSPPPVGCASGIALIPINVVVHAVGSLGAMITVPAAGSGGTPGAGVALAATGLAIVASVCLTARFVSSRRHR